VRTGSVSQYIALFTLSRRGKLRVVRSGRPEREKFWVICDKRGAVIVCNPSDDDAVRLPSIVSMPFKVIWEMVSLWMKMFPLIVEQLLSASASAWDMIVKGPSGPVGEVQLSSITKCQSILRWICNVHSEVV
jgi:hypothetical protein